MLRVSWIIEMILKNFLFLLKSWNACLFSTSSMLSFQVNSDLLLYSHAMELSFRSFMYTVDAEIVEITATDFISSLTVEMACSHGEKVFFLFKILFGFEKNVWLRLNFHYGNCVAEVNTEKPILLRQKPRQLSTAEVNYEDWLLFLTCSFTVSIRIFKQTCFFLIGFWLEFWSWWSWWW